MGADSWGGRRIAAVVTYFVDAKYVCEFTESGDSARRMSRLRFRIPMKAFTPGMPGSTNDIRVHTIGDAVHAKAPVWESGDHAD